MQVFELGLAVLHPEQAERKRPRQSAKRRVAGQSADDRTGAAEPLCHARKFGLGLKQQTVFHKERIAVELANHMKQVGPLLQPLSQLGARLGRKLRRRRIDHRQDRAERAGERLLVGQLTLAPRRCRARSAC